MSEFNSCLRSGKVSFGDDLHSVAEVTHLFGVMATKLPYHNWFNVPGKENTIACLLSEDGGDGLLDSLVPCQCGHESERRGDERGERLEQLNLELVSSSHES